MKVDICLEKFSRSSRYILKGSKNDYFQNYWVPLIIYLIWLFLTENAVSSPSVRESKSTQIAIKIVLGKVKVLF